MNKVLLVLSLILSASAFAATQEEENSGKATVEKSTSLMGTKKTVVKRKGKVKAADGSEVEKSYTDTTKVHKDGKVTRDARESVEVTPPDKKQ